MNAHTCRVTRLDERRLSGRLRQESHHGDESVSPPDRLRALLQEAELVEPAAAPANLVTMNSTVQLVDIDYGGERICTLVYPEAVNHTPGGVSVFDPLGTSLIGCEVGDVISCWESTRCRRLRVADILSQPERNGALDR